MSTMNGKRPATMPPRHHQQQSQQQQQQQPQLQQNDATSQHFDLIKYIYESWQSVSSELHNCHNQQQHGNSSNYRNSANVTYYQESEPNPNLKDFEPFDLEALWSQRGASIARNTSSS